MRSSKHVGGLGWAGTGLVSDGNDLVANGNTTIALNANNIVGDPNLGTLGNNAGQTTTLLPSPDSPVVNAGDPNTAASRPMTSVVLLALFSRSRTLSRR